MTELNSGNTPENTNLPADAGIRNVKEDHKTAEQGMLDLLGSYPALLAAISQGYVLLDNLWKHLPGKDMPSEENPSDIQQRVWKRLRRNMQIELSGEDQNTTPSEPLP